MKDPNLLGDALNPIPIACCYPSLVVIAAGLAINRSALRCLLIQRPGDNTLTGLRVFTYITFASLLPHFSVQT